MLARLIMKALRGVPVSPNQVCTDPRKLSAHCRNPDLSTEAANLWGLWRARAEGAALWE